MKNADYDAFVQALPEEFADRMTQERFGRMVEKHALMEPVREAIENNDYDAWVVAVSELPNSEELLELITEENFDTLVELHETMQKARGLSQELGIKGLGMKHGMRAGMRRCQWGE